MMGIRELRNQVSNINDSVSLNNYDHLSFFFSFLVAFFVLMLHDSIEILRMLTSLIIFPFTLLHEFGHYLAAIILLPSSNPVIELNMLNNGYSYAQISTNGLPICIESVLVMFSGSFILLLCTIGLLLLLRNKKSKLCVTSKYYLIFGILSDLPNIFPIESSIIGLPSDGYNIWIYLYVLINLPFPTIEFSIMWASIASIVFFTSYYYFGYTIYHLLSYRSPLLPNKVKKGTESII